MYIYIYKTLERSPSHAVNLLKPSKIFLAIHDQ